MSGIINSNYEGSQSKRESSHMQDFPSPRQIAVGPAPAPMPKIDATLQLEQYPDSQRLFGAADAAVRYLGLDGNASLPRRHSNHESSASSNRPLFEVGRTSRDARDKSALKRMEPQSDSRKSSTASHTKKFTGIQKPALKGKNAPAATKAPVTTKAPAPSNAPAASKADSKKIPASATASKPPARKTGASRFVLTLDEETKRSAKRPAPASEEKANAAPKDTRKSAAVSKTKKTVQNATKSDSTTKAKALAKNTNNTRKTAQSAAKPNTTTTNRKKRRNAALDVDEDPSPQKKRRVDNNTSAPEPTRTTRAVTKTEEKPVAAPKPARKVKEEVQRIFWEESTDEDESELELVEMSATSSKSGKAADGKGKAEAKTEPAVKKASAKKTSAKRARDDSDDEDETPVSKNTKVAEPVKNMEAPTGSESGEVVKSTTNNASTSGSASKAATPYTDSPQPEPVVPRKKGVAVYTDPKVRKQKERETKRRADDIAWRRANASEREAARKEGRTVATGREFLDF